MRTTTTVSAGLFAAWLVHDTEELITASTNSAELLGAAPRWLPVPADVRANGFSPSHMRAAIMLMALVMGSAAGDGVRTRGSGWWFQTVLNGFGVHGLAHLTGAVLLRRYTTGSVTSPVVMVPYWLWARRTLASAGVTLRPIRPAELALVPPLIVAVHALTRRLLHEPRFSG